MAVEIISLSISTKVWDQAGINLTTRSAVGLATDSVQHSVKAGLSLKWLQTPNTGTVKTCLKQPLSKKTKNLFSIPNIA